MPNRTIKKVKDTIFNNLINAKEENLCLKQQKSILHISISCLYDDLKLLIKTIT